MSTEVWYSIERDALVALAERPSLFFLKEFIPGLMKSMFTGEVLLDQALVDRLKSGGISLELSPSDIEGVHRVCSLNIADVPTGASTAEAVPEPPVPPVVKEPEVTVRTWNGNFKRTEFVEMVKHTLMPVIRRDVNVFVTHADGAIKSSTSDDKFCIFIWGSPARTLPRVAVPLTMWNTAVSCTDNHDNVCYPNADEGYVPIVTDEDDVVAAMNDKNLYIFFDAVHHGVDSEKVILTKILEQAVEVIKNGMKAVERSPEDLRRISETYRESYVKLCSERTDKDRRDLKREITSYVEKLEGNRREMMVLSAGLNRAQKVLSSFPEVSAENTTKFATEWDALLRVPKVRKVKCTPTGLEVKTDTIYVQHEKEKTWHKLGQFQIMIGINGDISFTNLSGRIKASEQNNDPRWNLNAPHVFGDGRACFGTVENTVRELCVKHEYAALVQVLLMFLGHANVIDAAGKNLVKWPEVTEAEATGKKAVKVKRTRKVQKEAA